MELSLSFVGHFKNLPVNVHDLNFWSMQAEDGKF